jgi:hypothetical protein
MVISLVGLEPSATSADHEPSHQPVRRLELFIQTIRIYDDNDPGGTGEWRLGVQFAAEPGGAVLNSTLRNSRAQSLSNWNVATELGTLAVYEGQRVRVQITGVEDDGGLFDSDDALGGVLTRFGESDGWGVGSHELRSSSGAYTVIFTIRGGPFPDLRVSAQPRSGTTLIAGELASVCVDVRNAGPPVVRDFWVDLSIDGENEMHLRFNAAHLPNTQCEKVFVTTPGSHRVRVVADSELDVLEWHEGNNRFEENWNWNVSVPPNR